MVANAIPSYLAFSNIGFGSVASNEMTMLMGRDDKRSALRVFQSCWWLIMLVCFATIVLLAAALWTLPIVRWSKLTLISESDARWILFALGTAVMFAQLEQLLGAAYTSVGRYPFGTLLKSIFSLTAYAIMFVPVALGYGTRVTAIVFAVANVAETVLMAIMVRRDVPWIRYGWEYASWAEIKRLTPPALAFMGFPMGNALNIQGTLLAVSWALGPADVVIFGTARTVSRVALQMVQLVNQTFWPELSSAFGAGNIAKVRSLHRRACQAALIIGLALIVIMLTIGPWFLRVWTLHQLPPGRTLLCILMVSVFFYAGWSTSSTLLTAINRHQKLASYYLFATGVTVVVTYFAARYVGLLAAAASLVLSELIMNFYVLPASLRLAEDTWAGFLGAMLTYPQALRPHALWQRLRRVGTVPGDTGEAEI
jgi:O-antigen/teichoic acid export membrane protein